jgi:hypothetical protein
MATVATVGASPRNGEVIVGARDEIGQMRGLLAEMGGLSALGVSGAPETAGGSKTWNESLGFIRARYVEDRCKELLKVVAELALEDGLTPALKELQKTLHHAADWEEAWYPLSDQKHEKFEQDQIDARWAVLRQYEKMFPAVKKFVDFLVPPTVPGLTWTQTRAALRERTQPEIKRLGWVTQTRGAMASDELAVALSALLTALHQYFDRYRHTKTVMAWTDA